MAAMGTRPWPAGQCATASRHDRNGYAAGVRRQNLQAGADCGKEISGIAPFYLTHSGSGRSCRLETRAFPVGKGGEGSFRVYYSQATRKPNEIVHEDTAAP